MRLAVYGGLSSVLAAGVILSAFTQRANFYSACVYLSKSSACMMILLNMGLFISIIAGKSLQAIFFGRLRAIEVEHLYERSWYAVTETCLAMTIFREEFDLQFVVVFTTLLFLKIFHWLCQDRVEFMEQTPSHGTVFHMRMINLMLLLFLLDYSLASHAIHATWTKGPNMMIMFGFEYTIMLCSILSSICKYTLNVIDLRNQEPWEGKSMYVFFVDLLTDFLKLVTYIVFFVIICFYYQLPLHIVRDVYVTFRSFIQKCRDLYRYRRATRNMDQLYPNASLDDLAQSSDSTCIICREEMVANASPPTQDQPQQNLDQPKKLPCGHIFHFHCLRSWLERQQTCPTCRRSVLSDDDTTTTTPPPENNAPPPAPAPQPQQQQQPYFFPRTQGPTPPSPNTNQPSPPQQQAPLPTFDFTTNATQQPIHIHGMIPLAPMTASSLPQHPPLPAELTAEQLAALSTETRQSMEERLRVLEVVQSQIFASMQYLASALSALPENTSTRTEDLPEQDEPSSSSRLDKGKMRSTETDG